MHRTLALSFVLVLSGCPGDTDPPDSGRDPDAGTDAGTSSTSCGDGIVDEGEECDDMNSVAFDGCEPSCTFTCEDASECDDQDPCSGEETCADNQCMRGPQLGDGTACTTTAISEGDCRGGRCVAVTCGDGARDDDEVCDDGNTVGADGCEPDCTFTCEGDDLDADDDGFASDDLGACGSDCDDTRADVFPGAPELCDGIDNDCNGSDDANVTWYVDCDRDGFASDTVGAVMACTEPAAEPCAGGGWTPTRPTGDATTDCDDSNEDMFPGQSRYFTSAHSTGSSDLARYGNYNCNGVLEHDRSTLAVSATASCSPYVIFGDGVCLGNDGWTSGTRACGSSGTYSDCRSTTRSTLGCERTPGCTTICPSDRANCDCSPGTRDCDLTCFCCSRTSTANARMGCR
jgi:cysteine-rich repeat protein